MVNGFRELSKNEIRELIREECEERIDGDVVGEIDGLSVDIKTALENINSYLCNIEEALYIDNNEDDVDELFTTTVIRASYTMFYDDLIALRVLYRDFNVCIKNLSGFARLESQKKCVDYNNEIEYLLTFEQSLHIDIKKHLILTQ